MAKIFDRLQGTAVRLLNKYVENPETGRDEPNCIWQKEIEGELGDPNKPWIRNTDTKVDFDVRIFFTRDKLEDRQVLKYLKDTEVVDGQVNGYMYVYEGLEPALEDQVIIKATSKLLTVKACDPIPPAGLPVVIYELEFGA